MVRRALVTVALLLIAAGGWWLWPATLGGGTTYLVTQGVSMEPRFHSGDLAIVRPASGYGVGDVVAYRSETLHSVVLHRIVAVDGGRFRLRGDNNSWLDPDRVPAADVLGRLVGRVPRGGDLLLPVRNPLVPALGSIVVMLGSALLRLRRGRPRRRIGHATRSRRRPAQRVHRPAWRHAAPSRAHGWRLPPHAITVTACASAAFLSVGVLAWLVPATRVENHDVPYTQRAALTYRASVPASPAYPTGRLVTGDPVYLALVPALDVAASYRVTTSGAVRARGHPLHGRRPRHPGRLDPHRATRAPRAVPRGHVRRAGASGPGRVRPDDPRRGVRDPGAHRRLHPHRPRRRPPVRGGRRRPGRRAVRTGSRVHRGRPRGAAHRDRVRHARHRRDRERAGRR